VENELSLFGQACALEWVSGSLGYNRNIGGELGICEHSSSNCKTSIWSLLSALHLRSLPPCFMDYPLIWWEQHAVNLNSGGEFTWTVGLSWCRPMLTT